MGQSQLSRLPLPHEEDLESRGVLKKLAVAHRHLAELKGVVRSIPNETILISTLTLQEAKDSSEVENIFRPYSPQPASDSLQPEATPLPRNLLRGMASLLNTISAGNGGLTFD